MLTRNEVQEVYAWKKELSANKAINLGALCFEKVAEEGPREEDYIYLRIVGDPETGDIEIEIG